MNWPEWYRRLNAASAAARAERLDQTERLERARAFIDARATDAIDLDAIARQAAFSRYHFLRAFRRAYGQTPHQYLTRRRLERARELLRETELPVTEVCFEVGFQSLGSFSSLFSRHVGHSPNRYRRAIVQSPGIPRLPPIPACFMAVFASR